MIILDIDLAINGDKEAYQRLIEQNKRYLYNISIAILNNVDDAGDALSETIIKAYQKLDTLRNPEYFRTWLTRILINECKKLLKTRRKVVSIEEMKENLKEKEDALQKETILDLRKAICSLEPKMKTVIVLHYYNELKLEEIAEILEIPVGTIKSRLYHAKKYLYEILEKGRRENNG